MNVNFMPDTKFHTDDEVRKLGDSIRNLEKQLEVLCNNRHCSQCPFGTEETRKAQFNQTSLCLLVTQMRQLVARFNICGLEESLGGDGELLDSYLREWVDQPKAYFKGFDSELKCRSMQYTVGKTFRVDGPVWLYEQGLHFCVNPLEVFEYYSPRYSRYCLVKPSEGSQIDGSADGIETKQCTDSLEILEELSLSEYIDKLRITKAYRYEIKGWFSYDTLTLGTNYAWFEDMKANTVVNNGMCSIAFAEADVFIASAAASAVFTNPCHCCTVAVASGSSSVVCNSCDHGIAVASGYGSIAKIENNCSVAAANGPETTLLVTGEACVAVNIAAARAMIRLENDRCVAVISEGDCVVTGEDCTVIIPPYFSRADTTVTGCMGTRIIFWDFERLDTHVFTIGIELGQDVPYTYREINRIYQNEKFNK